MTDPLKTIEEFEAAQSAANNLCLSPEILAANSIALNLSARKTTLPAVARELLVENEQLKKELAEANKQLQRIYNAGRV